MRSSLLSSRKFALTALFSLGTVAVYAQDAAATAEKSYGFNTDAWVTGVVFVAALVIVASFFITMRVIRIMADELRIARLKAAGKWTEEDEARLTEVAREAEAEVAAEEEAKQKRKSVLAALTDAVPVAREEEVLLDHDYDGIHELDNNLPPWWTGMFYITIGFAVIYLLIFEVFGFGLSSGERYEKQMVRAAAQKEALLAKQTDRITENSVTLLADAGALSAGEEIYVKNCATCHSQSGGGLLGAGPNLTDKYWIHGGGIKNVFVTIKYGVPTKGMISWKDQLQPDQMQEVASYILSLQGTNPSDGLEPQGEVWTPEGEEAPAAPNDSTEIEQAMDEATATALNANGLNHDRETE